MLGAVSLAALDAPRPAPPPKRKRSLAPLIGYGWTAYDIAFPAHARTLRMSYYSIESARLDQVVRAICLRTGQLSDADIEDMAQHCIDLFHANFDAKSEFWSTAHQANMNAYNKANKSLPTHLWPQAPRNSKNTPQGIAFFWHQLKHSWVPTKPQGFKFPKQPFSQFAPDPRDLF
jgi:hypothetical protein